jgi:hypothetical protein
VRLAPVIVLVLAACGGTTQRAPRLPPRRTRPAVDYAAIAAAIGKGPEYGDYDEHARPDGEWVFNGSGFENCCRAWFEHGIQVQWVGISGTERYVVDALDGGWRWQWWSASILRAEAGLAFAPMPWKPGEHVEFPYYEWPVNGACAGPFRMYDERGALRSVGTCAMGKMTEQIDYDDLGHVATITLRASQTNDSDTQYYAAGTMIGRYRIVGERAINEAWAADGTPLLYEVADGGNTIERRTWFADGGERDVDVTTAGRRERREYSARGRLLGEATWRDDTPTGTWRTWYTNGKPRSEVTFAGGEPSPLVVWNAQGRAIGEGDLANGVWTGRGLGSPSRVVAARAPRDIKTLELDGMDPCAATDAACLRELANRLVFPRACLHGGSEDMFAIWRGRLTLRIRFDRFGATALIAIPEPGALTQTQRECLGARETDTDVDLPQQIDVDLEVDTLTTGPDDIDIGDPQE